MSEPSSKAQQINLRCTYEEEACVEAAAVALGLTNSSVIELGLIQAVCDLGMTLLDDQAPRLRVGFVWPFEPKRPDGESAKTRITAYVAPAIYPAISSAAWAVRLSLPLFAIGAGLRFVAIARLVNERRGEAKEASEKAKFNPKLAKVNVPYDFDSLVKNPRH